MSKETEYVVVGMFNGRSKVKITMKTFSKTAWEIICGLFALAAVTALAFNIDPSVLKFMQKTIRHHLYSYLLT